MEDMSDRIIVPQREKSNCFFYLLIPFVPMPANCRRCHNQWIPYVEFYGGIWYANVYGVQKRTCDT